MQENQLERSTLIYSFAFYSICKSVYSTLVTRAVRTSSFKDSIFVFAYTLRFIDICEIPKRTVFAYSNGSTILKRSRVICASFPFFYCQATWYRASLIDIFTRVSISITSVFITGQPFTYLDRVPTVRARFIIAYTYNHANNGARIKVQLYYYRPW